MARTTAALVRGIIETDDVTIPDLDPFIDTSNTLVTECCAGVAAYDAARLELIERWLAAHFYAIRDNRRSNEQADVSQAFQYKLGLILQVTMYGQQALMLDTAGGLAALSKKMEKGVATNAGLTWLGTDYDEDTEE